MAKYRIVIVDDQNKVIGAKPRDEVDYDQDIYRSTGIWITNSDGQILIAQRKLTKEKDPGKWGPAAAGTVDEGETYESNARKELSEEIGLRDVELTVGPQHFVTVPRRQFVQWFVGQADVTLDQLTLQPEEVEAAQWIEPAQLVADVQSNPDKYVGSMAIALEQLGYLGH
jgi:isopentenyldiphosphate isomerase